MVLVALEAWNLGEMVLILKNIPYSYRSLDTSHGFDLTRVLVLLRQAKISFEEIIY